MFAIAQDQKLWDAEGLKPDVKVFTNGPIQIQALGAVLLEAPFWVLPLPMLDGGHLALYTVEAVRRRPLGERAQEWIFRRSYDDDYVPERVRRRAPCY